MGTMISGGMCGQSQSLFGACKDAGMRVSARIARLVKHPLEGLKIRVSTVQFRPPAPP